MMRLAFSEPDALTEDQLAEGAFPRVRVIAQKAWNSPLLTPRYAEFESIREAIGHAPGYDIQ